jgi:hypothetical protein
MREIPYSYWVIQYVHDVSIGEVLNIGTVFYAPRSHFLRAMIDESTARLESAFRGFEPEFHRQFVTNCRLEMGLAEERVRGGAEFDISKSFWKDNAMSYRVTSAKSGICDDPVLEVDQVFERFVTSQTPSSERKRTSA